MSNGAWKEFLKLRKRGIAFALTLEIFFLIIRFGFPETYTSSRFAILIDFWIFLGFPGAIYWEWRQYKRESSK